MQLFASFLAGTVAMDAKEYDGKYNCQSYLARYPDLMNAFGNNCGRAYDHYVVHGMGEGRSAVYTGDAFDCQGYLSRYPDLQRAFKSSCSKAFNHYVKHGRHEGRDSSANEDFKCETYLARYPDLMNAFGYNCEAAFAHYLQNGNKEGRDSSADTSVWHCESYLAKHRDLQNAFGHNCKSAFTHYVNHGRKEGRAKGQDETGFQCESYTLRHDDLKAAFKSDCVASFGHYLSHGWKEGRDGSGGLYSCDDYLARYPDLQAAFGTNCKQAWRHYINHGEEEGRNAAPSKHWTIAGNSLNNKNEPALELDSTKHEVRCCSESSKGRYKQSYPHCNVFGASDVPKCFHASTYDEAKAQCANDGARLCTAEEIADDCTAGSGCMHDLDMIWTSSTKLVGDVSTTSHAVAAGGSHVNNNEPTLELDSTKHEVRCCSEKANGRYKKRQAWCDVFGASSITKCYDGKEAPILTYENAKRTCAADGARLCTVEEVTNDCTRGSGCAHDADMVWTSSTELPESIAVEMSIDETVETFTAAKQNALKAKIAAQLQIRASSVFIEVGMKQNPIDSRRLAEALLITVTIQVVPSKASEEVTALESPAFAAATGAQFLQFKPAHGSAICATCTWNNDRIQVTHYINAQKTGEKGLQHKCYHIGDVCKCFCK